MAPLVMCHEMSVAGKELGALGAFGQLDRCALRLAKDLLISLQRLLLDLRVRFQVYERLLLRAHLVFKLQTTRFL